MCVGRGVDWGGQTMLVYEDGQLIKADIFRQCLASSRLTVMASPDSASPETVGEVDSLFQVTREDRGSQAVNCLVSTLDKLRLILELHDLHHWPKNLKSSIQNKTSYKLANSFFLHRFYCRIMLTLLVFK